MILPARLPLLRPRPHVRPAPARQPLLISPLAALDAEIQDLQAGLSRAAGNPALIAQALRDARAERIALIEAAARPQPSALSPAQQLVEDRR